MHPATASGGRGRREQGSIAVEAAVVLPALLLFTMLIVQVGMFLHARAVAASAARQGLDAARVVEGSEAAGTAASLAFLEQAHSGIEAPSVVVERGPEEVTVTISGEVMSLVPAWSPVVTVTISAPTERTVD